MGNKAAVIDVGTNSVRLLIARVNEREVRNEEHFIETTRLGEGWKEDKQRLKPEAVERTYRAVEKFCLRCREKEVEKIKILGTSALREAENRQELQNRIRDGLHLDLQILSEEEEALYSYRGAVHSLPLPPGRNLLIDVGGGSTEGMWREEGHLKCRSFPLGAVRLKEKFASQDPPASSEVKRMEEYLETTLAPFRDYWQGSWVIATGGTVTALASIKNRITCYRPELIHGERLRADEIEQLLQRFLSLSLEDRKRMVGLPPQRADIMVEGTLIVKACLKMAEAEEVLISEADLLAGALTDNQRIVI